MSVKTRYKKYSTRTYGAFGLANAEVEPLFGTLAPPAGARGVIINFLKSSFVIGCSDLKQQFHTRKSRFVNKNNR